MSPKNLFRLLLGLTGLLVLGIVIGAWQFNNLFQQRADHLTDQRRQIAALDGQQDALNKAKADIAKYNQLASIAKSIVPQDKSQAETVRQIVKIAKKSGIDIATINFPTSSLGGKTKLSKPDLSQLEPAKGIAGVYVLEISVASSKSAVSYDKFINFLKGLENNRRTALVSTVSIQPAEKGSGVTFNLTLEEYIKP